MRACKELKSLIGPSKIEIEQKAAIESLIIWIDSIQEEHRRSYESLIKALDNDCPHLIDKVE